MLQAEQVLQGRYQLQRLLGQNAGRQTWLAVNIKESPAQRVIVKLLAFNPQMHWDEHKLFDREAQVLKHLNHARIPQYRDYFCIDREAGAGLPWFGLVQEYIPGDSLQHLLDMGQRFTQKQALHIATSVLEILTFLHELSPPVFHRDIKPSNLILGKDGRVYLVDFGAVQDRATAEGVTFTVVGTNGYTPPEQLWGRAVPASDLYALGATLIHLLTGIPPADLPQRQMRIQFSDRVRLDPRFAQWLEQLTEPSPERRFSTARQALSALPANSPTQKASQRDYPRRSGKGDRSSVCYSRLAGLAFLQVAVIGLATTLVVPAFHIQTTRAKYAEAKHNMTRINRAQQNYHTDNYTFSDSLPELNLDIPTQTTNYEYSTRTTANAAFSYGVSRNGKLKSYVGGVFLIPPTDTNAQVTADEELTRAILCEAASPGTIQLTEPTLLDGQLACSPGTANISR